MINLKHAGLYVNNLKEMVKFYKECFDMELIVDGMEDSGTMFDQLFQKSNVHVKISKLIK